MEESEARAPAGFECVFCGSSERVIQHTYCGMCVACVNLARDTLGG